MSDAKYLGLTANKLAEIASELEDENAKLRQLVTLLSVMHKHLGICSTLECGQCLVHDECDESVWLEGVLGIDTKEASWRVQERMIDMSDVTDKLGG